MYGQTQVDAPSLDTLVDVCLQSAPDINNKVIDGTCTYVCMYVCMYVCIDVMDGCMYVYVCMYACCSLGKHATKQETH